MKTLSNKLRLFCCPLCGGVMAGYGAATSFCCGTQLDELPIIDGDPPTVQEVDGGYYLQFNNPMSKDFYITAIVVEYFDHYEFYRLFPEQDPSIHIAQTKGVKLHTIYRQQHKVWQTSYKF